LRRLNVVGEIVAPGEIRWRVLAPGATNANPQLQLDASRYVFQAALSRLPGCKDAYLDQTEFLGRESATRAGATGPAVHERWTVVACGHIVPVAVAFVPDAAGTQIGAGVERR
jgi:hypothetical protein